MRKTIFFIALFLLISVIGIAIGIYIANLENIRGSQIEYITQMGETKITDECVKEGQELLETNATQDKVSPNAILIMKRYYPECEHTITSYMDAPENIVNLSENELKEKYQDWEIEGFSPNEIVIRKEETGICNEHYLLQEEDGRIVVYSIGKDNQQKLYERTGILTQYLTRNRFNKSGEGYKSKWKREFE